MTTDPDSVADLDPLPGQLTFDGTVEVRCPCLAPVPHCHCDAYPSAHRHVPPTDPATDPALATLTATPPWTDR
jgi:hypothetical protein